MPRFLTWTALVLLASGVLGAADCTFTGTVDATWSNAGNWSPAAVPVAGKTVDIPSGKTATLDVTTPALGAITVEGSLSIAQALHTTSLGSSGTLSLNGGSLVGVTLSSGTLVCQNNGSNLLDGVTLAAGTTLDLGTVYAAQCYLNNTTTINGTVQVGNAGGSTYGRVYWNTVATTWNGSGAIVFGASSNNNLSVQQYNATLTIASTLTIHGISGAMNLNYGNTGTLVNHGTITSDGGGTVALNLFNWTNDGTISSGSGSILNLAGTGTGSSSGALTTTGGTLSVGGSGTWSTTVANGVTATNGTLNLGGAWSATGSGTIATAGSAINLGGSFTTAQALAVQHTGTTTISITGALNNASATLALSAATGSWYLNGGSITSGTITGAGGSKLICANNGSNLLDGVKLAASATLDLATVYAAQCYLNNTTTINGTVLVGDAGNTTYGRVYWNSATTVWNGTGSIVFGASSNNNLSGQAYSTTLTIGSGLTIHGTNGSLNNDYGSTGTVVNHGTITSDGGGTIGMTLWAWTNTGTLSASAGSTLTLNATGAWSNSGTISGASGSVVTLNNSGTGGSTGSIASTGGTLNVGGSGTWNSSVANGITVTNGTLSLGGAWTTTGAGTIATAGSAINLGGTFTTAQALAVQHSGATTISITGTLDNSSTTLPLGPSTGSWYLNGGKISGGTVTGTLNERLICQNSGNVLDGVTLAASATLDLATVYAAQCYLNNTVTIDGTVLVGSSDGSTYGRIYWNTATTAWNGTGSIVFGGSTNNNLTAQAYSTTLTLGSGLLIHGTNGSFNSTYGSTGTVVTDATITSDGGGTIAVSLNDWTNNGTWSAIAGSTLAVASSGTWSNTGTISGASGTAVTLNNSGTGSSSGTISTNGGVLTVGGSGTWSTTAAGGVTATNGTLTLGGTWGPSGAGTIVTSGSVVNLGGSFTTAQALAVQHSGTTTISITGALNNASSTLHFGPSTGSWYLNGGTITGGTISGTASQKLICQNATNVLDGVTLAANLTLDLQTIYAAECYLNNTVTINGTVLLGSSDGSTYGRVFWSTATTAWNGTGSFVLGGSTNNNLSEQQYSTTLTIGSGLLIHGVNGSLNSTYGSTGTLINNGTVTSDGGGTIAINLTNWTNNGTFSATAGSALAVASGGTWSNTGTISGASGTTVTLNNSGTGSSSGTISSTGGALTVGGSGTWNTSVAGGVTVTNGTLTLGGTWAPSGAGTIVTSGSTINLGGAFTTAQALAVQHSGTTLINVTGAMNNSAATLPLGPSTGSWYMDGGSITGGTISGTASEKLICRNQANVLDGVTLAANLTLDLETIYAAQCYLNNTVTINGTVLVGSSDSSTYGRVFWSTATTAWNGTGSFVFGGSSNNNLSEQQYSTTLTIGSGLLIHGVNGSLNSTYGSTGTLINNGTVTSDGGGTIAVNLTNWTNNGTISATGGSALNLASSGTWSNTGTINGTGSSTVTLSNSGTGSSSGTIAVTGGALTVGGSGTGSTSVAGGVTVTNGTLTLGGTWGPTGAGTIVTSGTVIYLGGSFTTAQALAVQHSGATTITITGALNNASATLPLDPSTGSWYLDGGSITGGTLTGTVNEKLICRSNGSNLLDGVTLAASATLDLETVYAALCYLNNTTTIDGTVRVGSTDGSTYGRIWWSTTTTNWNGSGAIVLGGSTNNNLTAEQYNTTLTIGSGLTIHGINGSLNATYGSTGSLVNNGTISNDGGGSFSLNSQSFTNNGTINVGSGAYETWNCAGPFIQSASGTLIFEIGGTSAGQFDRLSFSGGSNITLGGTVKILSTGGFTPTTGTHVDIITTASGTVSGTATVPNSYTLGYGATQVTATGLNGLTAPTVVLTSTAPDPTSGTITVDANFSAPVTGVTATDFVTSNATVSGLSGSGASYSFTLVPSVTQGTVGVTLPAGAATDAGDLSNAASNTLTRVFSTVDPTVTVINPASGTTAGGNSVAITGTGFLSGSTQVTFGGAAATVTGVTATRITCTAPSGTPGVVNVVVTVAGRPVTKVGGYTYNAPVAADAVFNGSVNNTWNTAANWTPAAVPTAGQIVDIPAGLACALNVSTPALNTVAVEGTLILQGSFTLQTTTLTNNGVVQLNGTTLKAGTVSGSPLVAANATNVLDVVALNADLDLTQTNAAQATITNTVTLGSGNTIAIGAPGGSTYGYLNFIGGTGNIAKLASAGSSAVVLGSSVSNLIRDNAGSTIMTLAGGITVSGGAGTIYATNAGSTLSISGQVNANTAGQTITIGNGSYANPITLSSTVQANGGILTLTGTWSNTGTIGLFGGTVNLGGSFAETSVQQANWNRSGGTVNLTGTLTIGGTLTHTSLMGVWQLAGGTIRNGTLTSTGGTLVALNATNLIDGVALDANLDLTQFNAAQVTITNTVTLGTGRTISVGASDGSTYGFLNFIGGAGSHAILASAGTSSVVLGASSSNLVRDNASSTLMELGSGITVTGGTGSVYVSNSGSTLTINGIINAAGAGQTITVGNNTDVTTINGTVKATAGILTLAGAWVNNNHIGLSSGTVNLGGAFGEGSVQDGNWQRTGGTVNLTGTLTIGTTLTHTTGVWQLAGGTIRNGTLTATSGLLVALNATNLLDGVTLDADLDLTQVNGAQVTITNTVTLGAGKTISVGAAGGGTYGYLNFIGGAGSHAILASAGASSVVLGASSSNLVRDNASSTLMELGTGITVTGGAGNVYVSNGSSTLTINGVIDAAGAGQTITVGYNTDVTTISGTVQASGGILTLAGTWTNGGHIGLSSGGTVNLGGSFNETSVADGQWNRSGGTVHLTGTLTIGTTLTHTTGVWQLAGGTIRNGTLTATSGLLVALNATNLLDGVTLDADLDLTQVNGAQVTITNTVTLGAGKTISVGAAGGGTYGYLNFVAGTGNIATLASAGASSVVLGSSSSNLIRDQANSTQLVLDSGITVTGGAGNIYTTYAGSLLTIGGIVTAATSGQTITVGYNNIPTLITGTVQATGGILTMAGTWSSTGTIGLSSGTVNLGGSFDETSVQNARWSRSGGTVNLTGTLTIGGTLTHTAAMGVWQLAGCMVRNGTLTSTGGTLVGLNTTNTLDGVTLNADLDLTQVNGAQATITNTVTLGAGRTIAVGAAGGGTYGYLNFVGGTLNNATLASAGASSVVLGASGSNLIRDQANTTQLVLGSGITVSGGAGTVYATYTGSTLTIAGTIDAASIAKTITIGYNTDLTTVTGTLNASAGILTLAGSWANSGTISTTSGTVNLGGAFGYTSVASGRWARTAGDTVNLTGVLTIGAGNTLTLDAGTGTWKVLGGTLVDGTLDDAGSRLVFTSTAGALDGVTIPAGSVLDLGLSNGAICYLNHTVTIDGTIKVGRTDGATYSRLYWSTTSTWGGSGDILFGASTANAITAQAGVALTIASPLLIHGQNAAINATYGGSSITNNGTLATDVPGGGFSLVALSFTNNGTVIVGQQDIQNWSCADNFTQSASGVLELEIAGGGVGQADRLAFSGAATIALDGTLRLISGSGFVPTATTAVDILTIGSGTITGSFATVEGVYSLNYGATKVSALGVNGLNAPTLTLSSAAGDPTIVSPIPVTATFSASVSGFTQADVLATNATVSNFSGSGTTYTFDLIPAVSQGTVGVSVPAGSAYDAQFLTNPASNALQWFYNGVTPTITGGGISPTVGTHLGGTTVTITGTGFVTGQTAVTFGGVMASVGTVTSTSISCTTPAGTAGTTVDVQVVTAGQTATATAAFTYSALALPSISTLTPASDDVAGGATITITGVNLTGTTGVTFATLAATAVTVVDASTVTCVTPAYAGAPGAVDVVLTTGVGSTTATAGFYYGNSPTVAITPAGTITNSAPITFTLTFSAPVTGLTTGGLTVTNGAFGALSGSGAVYTIPVTPSADGAVTLAVNANAAQDTNALGNVVSNTASVTYDSIAPVVSQITPNGGSTGVSPIPFVVVFSEPVSGLTAAGLTLVDGTAGTITTSDSLTWQVPVTPGVSGTVSLQVKAGAANDAAGNGNGISATIGTTYAVGGPTVAMTPVSGLFSTAPITFTVTFSAPVTGFSAAGLTIVNGSAGTVSGSGAVYTVPVTPTADGTVTVSVAAGAAVDSGSNANSASGAVSVTYDSTKPSAVVTPSATASNSSPITFTLTFNEPVTGLTTSGLTVTNGTLGALSGSGTVYTIPVTPSAQGAVKLKVKANAASDAAGNSNTASATATVTYDNIAPTVTAITPNGGTTNASPIPFTVTFSETVVSLSAGGLTVVNGTVGTITTSDSLTWQVPVTPTAQGTVSLTVTAGAAHDAASNGCAASSTVSTTYSTTGPTVAVTPASGVFGASPIAFTVTFSAPVTGFSSAGLSIANGTAGAVSGSGAVYTVPVTATADGTVTVSVLANAAVDAGTNPNSASSAVSVTYDSVKPSVVVTPNGTTSNVSPITYTLTFSEPVTGLTTSGLTVTNGVLGALSGSGTVYTVPVTPSADGAVKLKVKAAAASDAAGNDNTVSATATVTYDSVAPTVTTITPNGGITNVSPVVFAVTFSEAVSGLSAGGLTVVNGVVGTITTSDSLTWQVPVTPSAQGTVSITVQAGAASDAGGNASVASSTISTTYSTTGPTVAVTPTTGAFNAAPIAFTVTFSGPVTGFTSAGLSITNGTAGAVSGSGAVYTVPVTPTADGTVTVSVLANAAVDAGTNPNSASTAVSVTYDSVKPSVVVTPDGTATNAAPITYMLTFSEAVTGLTTSGLTVGNGVLGALSGSGTVYTIPVTPSADGAVTLKVKANAASDAAGNSNSASTTAAVTYDSVAPTVALTPNGTTTALYPLVFTLTASEAVSGLTLGDLTATNATLSNLQGGPTVYTVDALPSATGTVQVTLVSGAVHDVAGNATTAATTASLTFTSQVAWQAQPDAVAFIGKPFTALVVASSTFSAATITISETGSALAPLGLTLTSTGNGTATIGGTIGAVAPGTYAVALSADDGGSTAALSFNLHVIAVPPPTLVAAPTLPITGAHDESHFATVGLSTPQGIASFLAAIAGKDNTQVRAFAFDASTQGYVELPQQPAGGLTVSHALFVVTRIPLGFDLGGDPLAMPGVLILQPGWNFLTVPPLHDGTAVQTTHPWDFFQLQAADGSVVANTPNLIGTPGGPLASTQPWLWNGSDYVQVSTLDSGVGYWFKNNGSLPLRLVRLPTSNLGGPGAVKSVAHTVAGRAVLRQTIVDRGTPPAPPESSSAPAAAADSSGGGSCGSGAGVVLLLGSLCGFFLLRSPRRR